MSANPIYGYLETLPKEYRVSDFHMRSGSPLAMRVNGEIEVSVCVPAVRNLIREDKIPQIGTVIQTGSQFGMITMDQYGDELKKQNLIVIEND